MSIERTAELADLTGRRALITGATGGLGYATARALARAGATVLLTTRNPARGDDAARRLLRDVPGADLRIVDLDLARFSSVRRVADGLLADGVPLDMLVANAGQWPLLRKTTEDGNEETFQVNYLSHALLILRLLPLLHAAGQARIVHVSSTAHYAAVDRSAEPNLRDFWDPMSAYTWSKLAQIIFSTTLATRLAGSGVTSNAVHPGAVATGLFRGWPLVGWMTRLVLASPDTGARAQIAAAASPAWQGVNGDYRSASGPEPMNPEARNPANQQRLWDRTLELCDVADPFSDQARTPMSKRAV